MGHKFQYLVNHYYSLKSLKLSIPEKFCLKVWQLTIKAYLVIDFPRLEVPLEKLYDQGDDQCLVPGWVDLGSHDFRSETSFNFFARANFITED